MQTHSPVEIRLKDLTALKQYADSFVLPVGSKKTLTGTGSAYSPFKSRGLDFQEVRVYQPGDDIRQIDWHVTAKYGKPFTKLYTEEKERTIFFVVDLRSSMRFATHGDFKSVIAARLTALVTFVAEHQKDKIGYLLLMDSGIISSCGADVGIVSELLNILVEQPSQRIIAKGGFSEALHLLIQFLPMGSFVFLLSDFYDWKVEHTALLAPISEKNTLLFVSIYDQLEMRLPNETLAFSNGKETIILEANNKKFQQNFEVMWEQKQKELQSVTTKYGWGFLPVRTDSDYLPLFVHFCFGGILDATRD